MAIRISTLTTPLVLTLALGFGMAASAQETAPAEAPATEAPATEVPTTEAPADVPAGEVGEMSLGEPAAAEGGVGAPYTAATHGDWEQRCIKTDSGKDPCELYQLLKDDNGNSVAEISMFSLPAGGEAAAGATIITPLETLLTQMLTMSVDTAKPKRYPFTFCSVQGCVARVGFTAEEVEGFKKGAKATMVIVPAVAPDEKVNLNLSLKGFTAGYDAVKTANEAADAPAQ